MHAQHVARTTKHPLWQGLLDWISQKMSLHAEVQGELQQHSATACCLYP